MEIGKPNLSPKVQALIDAARKRTEEMLKHSQQKIEINTNVLPNSAMMQQAIKIVDEMEGPKKVMIVGPKGSFDPYELDGLILNKEQRLAVDLFGLQGKSGCLIGPAGTGKTTTMKAVIRAAIMSGRIPILSEDMEHKYLQGGLPGIFGGSFTRIATRNLRDNCPVDIKGNIHTIHRLLEFEPEIIEVDNPAKPGEMKKIRIFKPTRHTFRTLPRELCMFLTDESSMVGTKLEQQRQDAIHPLAKAQNLYIGDIAQLPPVMDDATLGYKMLEYLKPEHNSLVELIQVYRHAGAIVNMANDIRVGQTMPRGRQVIPYLGKPSKLPMKSIREWYKEEGWAPDADNIFSREEDGSKVTVQYWKNRLDGEVGQLRALHNLRDFFIKHIDSGEYDPLAHMILMPYNVSVGTIELNRYIAQYLGKKRNAEVYEIISGFQKHYLAIGDKVFHDREESIITKISHNAMYAGTIPVAHSITLDRWGHNSAGSNLKEEGFDDIEAILNINIDGISDEERKNQSSHIIEVKKLAEIKDEGEDKAISYTLNTAAEINSLLFGYALTIHKSQGSQWPKVYCIFHNSHNRNLQRELLYTAITRAQKELFVICEPETLIQGVTSQHITGNTLAEKAEYFKGKIATDKARKDMFNGE